jgi:hypothetical protein
MTEKILKLEIARRQIETALDLFFGKKDMCSVVTLAGAGEEILGRLLKHRGEDPALSRLIGDVKSIAKELWPEYEFPGEKYFADKANLARNLLKHLDDPNVETLELDLFYEAFAMLNRAIENYQKLGGELSEKMKRFQELLDTVRKRFDENKPA